MVKDLDKVTESEMDVDPEYHRHFVLRRGEILRQISDDLGGVSISFPKAGTTSTRVILKGNLLITALKFYRIELMPICWIFNIFFLILTLRTPRMCRGC